VGGMGYWCFGYGFYRWYGLIEIHTTAVAMFGSTRVTDQPSAHSAATAASVGASSLTMPPSSMVPRCEAIFPSERKEEKCYLEDRMKTVFVSTFIRALAANECDFVWLLHSGRAS